MLDLERARLDAVRAFARQAAPILDSGLSLELWNGEVLPLGPAAKGDVRLVVRSSRALRRLLLAPGLVTACELYAMGEIDVHGGSPLEAADLWDHSKALALGRRLSRGSLLRLAWPFVLGARGRPPAPAEGAYEGAVAARLEAGRDDQALIRFHYDVSNDFYAAFLDPELVYSCGYFATPETSLADAQIAKLDRICRKLRLSPGERLLDIGCGWGALLCHAAANYGVVGHGVTLSEAQLAYARDKVARLGLADRVTVELRDYRTLEGPFDKIAQIEMVEHIGIDNHDRHYAKVHALLRPRGLYLHQASTRMATRDLARFRRASPYQRATTRFVFPGGELDHVGFSTTNLERLGFEVHDVEAMREHFALTCRHWASRLWDNRATAEREIGAARTRIWLLYLVMTTKAFERNTMGVFQTLASRRRAGPSGLGLVRVG